MNEHGSLFRYTQLPFGFSPPEDAVEWGAVLLSKDKDGVLTLTAMNSNAARLVRDYGDSLRVTTRMSAALREIADLVGHMPDYNRAASAIARICRETLVDDEKGSER
jgi:hypothetical protein